MPTIAVDLDGTLLQWSGGWRGIEHFGTPFPGATEFTRELKKLGKVIIHSCRMNLELNRNELILIRARHLGYDPSLYAAPHDPVLLELARQIVGGYLDHHGLAYDELWDKPGKPIASAYIDDRAICCSPAVLRATDVPDYDTYYRSIAARAKSLCRDGLVINTD